MRALISLILCSPMLACGGSNGGGTDASVDAVSGPCDFDVSVTTGLNPSLPRAYDPVYAWTGDAVELSVARAADLATVVWGLASLSGVDYVPSPLPHGTDEPIFNVSERSTLELALTDGVDYRVTVTLADSRVGCATFTHVGP